MERKLYVDRLIRVPNPVIETLRKCIDEEIHQLGAEILMLISADEEVTIDSDGYATDIDNTVIPGLTVLFKTVLCKQKEYYDLIACDRPRYRRPYSGKILSDEEVEQALSEGVPLEGAHE